MILSVVIVNWNSKDDLEQCLHSLTKQTFSNLEVIVVDNDSSDGSKKMVQEKFGSILLLPQSSNLGFAEACNRGIEIASGDWIALLNNDAVADPFWAETLMDASTQVDAKCGMLQSLLIYSERQDTINSTGIILKSTGNGSDRKEGLKWVEDGKNAFEEIFCPTAGAAAYRRKMLEEIKQEWGYMDPDHFCYYEDMDMGWRARLAGWSAFFIPKSMVFHKYHASTERKGKAWLKVKGSTNRIRTLFKNGSTQFLWLTLPWTMYGALNVFCYGNKGEWVEFRKMVSSGLKKRINLTSRENKKRRECEITWVGKI